jgi:hypothetical protein
MFSEILRSILNWSIVQISKFEAILIQLAVGWQESQKFEKGMLVYAEEPPAKGRHSEVKNRHPFELTPNFQNLTKHLPLKVFALAESRCFELVTCALKAQERGAAK